MYEHLYTDTFDERAIKSTQHKNDKTTRISASAESERERGGIRSVYGVTSFRAKCIQSARAENFPNPFPLVVHGVLQELADVGTAGNPAARSSSEVAR